MPQEQVHSDSREALQTLAGLRRFSGPATQFWPAFIAAAGAILGATRGALIVRDAANPEQWKKLGDWSSNGHADRVILTFTRSLADLGKACVESGTLTLVIGDTAVPTLKNYAIAARLQLQNPDEICIAAFLLLDATAEQAEQALVRLQLAADVPVSYQTHHLAEQSRGDLEKFASVLDLLTLVNTEKRFLAAAMAFCNGLATRYHCDRVSLGWLDHGYIRLRAISRTEKFDRSMAAAKALEVAMEEALDQDEEIVWPAPEGATFVARDHEQFAREQTAGHVCSLPLRWEDKVVAVFTCERQARPFSQTELQQLRLTADQAVRLLYDLKRQDRWFGARWATATREKLATLVGPEHTWAKALAVVVAVLLAVLVFGKITYRVEGEFILRSDQVSYLTAPFDGFIGDVFVRTGDAIEKDRPLLQLNTNDLLLEEAGALADLNRYEREGEKARAANALAEMRIAAALADQSRARLDLIRYRLEQSALKVPFDGVVVEGDLREKLGSPVKQGDALFRVARTDSLYVEAEVKERDIHELLDKSTGEIAFVSQPKLKFPVRIVQIEPAAIPRDSGNVFMVRCEVEGVPEEWWRPGMSGLCKLNVGKRTFLWIFTHRTVDFLRLWLWW